MSHRIQAVRGMPDVLPEKTRLWRFLERRLIDCAVSYGYSEIRMPVLESTQLFKRSVGEVTDIVEKEMYTFTDRNGESISLRPEGTAGCVRACLEHGLLHNQQQRLMYLGPMFRHEKPQKGRYRQFYQFGVEAFGMPGVGIELELLALCYRIFCELGVQHDVILEVNNLGEMEERVLYRQQLTDYLHSHRAGLDDDSRRRLETNPLRVLDSKNPQMVDIIQHAPQLMDCFNSKSRDYFALLCQGLDAMGIPYRVNPRLVRGLDYYQHTVFEWVSTSLGSQSAVCAGGRFNGLVEQLGGKPTPAVGFALGLERLLLLCESSNLEFSVEAPVLYVMADGELALLAALVVAERLRKERPDWLIEVNQSGGSLKNQFKKADKSGAWLALILGEDERQSNSVSVKKLRENEPQQCVAEAELMAVITEYLASSRPFSENRGV